MIELVHLCLESPDRRWGGLATAVHLLAEATSNAGILTTVVSAEGRSRSRRDASRYRLVIAAVPQLGDHSFYESSDRTGLGNTVCVALLDTVRSIHSSNNVDLIVHNEELAPIINLARLESWVRTVAVVSHGLMPQEHPESEELYGVQRQQLASADLVFAVSRSQVNQLASYFPNLSRVCYLPLPLSRLVQRFHDQLPRPRVGLLVSAGRSVRQKGFDLLLRAYAELDIDAPLALTLVLGHGDDAYESKCRALAAVSSKPVHVHDWLDRISLLRLIATSAAVVVPSRFEPLGLIAAEAMAFGRPVVASNVGGLAELVSSPDVGVLVPVSDLDGPHPDDLRMGLEAVLSRGLEMTSGQNELLNKYGEDKCIRVLATELGW